VFHSTLDSVVESSGLLIDDFGSEFQSTLDSVVESSGELIDD
jgi:hypothetical protein